MDGQAEELRRTSEARDLGKKSMVRPRCAAAKEDAVGRGSGLKPQGKDDFVWCSEAASVLGVWVWEEPETGKRLVK